MAMLTHAEETPLAVLSDNHDKAFDELYSSYFPRVYNYVHYRVDDFYDADDLTSQIFTKLFSSLKCYRPEKAPFAAWVFRIARNTVTDYYRSRRWNPLVSMEIFEELLDCQPGPDAIVTLDETRQHLYKALAFLTQREREIIALKFWSGCTNRDIAGMLGLSESNIGVIIFRAMRRLRLILESQGMSIDDGNH